MLEDHLGDVISKGRKSTGTSAEVAANAGGLSAHDLSSLEESGKTEKEVDYAALAKAVGLNPDKLVALAEGWQPAEPDLSRWRELRRITTNRGMAVNCYLIWDEATKEAALFDTGWDAGPVKKLISENGLELKHLFITHTHEDHIYALTPIRQAFPKVRVHSNSKNVPVEQRLKPEERVSLGSLRITYRETPGHAVDGVTYLIGNWPDDAPHVAIVGDAIFAGSMGNGFQSWELAKEKVASQILSLPSSTLICPGHGPFTTVAEEKAHNPFF